MANGNQVEGAAAPTQWGSAGDLEPTVDVRGYLDWGAIIAGALLAAATSFVLYSFGAALGLSFTLPQSGSEASGTMFVILVGAWLVVTQVASFGVGGYRAGRLRGVSTPPRRQRSIGMTAATGCWSRQSSFWSARSS